MGSGPSFFECASCVGDDSLPDPDEAKQPLQSESTTNKEEEWISAVSNGHGNVQTILALAEQYGEDMIVHTRFEDGDLAVHKAVRANNFELLRELINTADAHADGQNGDCDTPLILSVKLKQPEMTEFLLGVHPDYKLANIQKRANKYMENGANQTAADYADPADSRMWVLLQTEKSEERKTVESPIHSPDSPYSPSTPYSPENLLDVDDQDDDESSSELDFPPQRRQSITLSDAGGEPSTPGGTHKDTSYFYGYLEKRLADRSRFTTKWKKRFVVVRGEYIGWAGHDRVDRDMATPEQRQAFKSCHHLNRIVSVEKVVSKTQRKFRLEIRPTRDGPQKIIEFAARNEEERNKWVEQLIAKLKSYQDDSRFDS